MHGLFPGDIAILASKDGIALLVVQVIYYHRSVKKGTMVVEACTVGG